MRRFLGIALFIVMLGLAWRIGSMLSSDAIGMAIGMVLGVLAGLPTAALVLWTRSRDRDDDARWQDERESMAQRYGYQPPVIVLTGAPAYQGLQPPPPQAPAPQAPWPPEQRERSFRIVGEIDQPIR